ncbi:MAG: hypothetical protein SVP52_03700, partial [Chloroflexota bacterium]|nr:hypothetical protein [Chloroflexota bacterium]
FIYENQRISNPDDFVHPPKVTNYTPSSVQIEAKYRDHFEFEFICYLPEPDVLTGSIQIRNLQAIPINITVQLAVKLVPMGKGQPSHPEKWGGNQFLAGKTDTLEPILFMTGGPSAINNPFPALSLQLDIEAQHVQDVSWVLVSKESKTKGLEKARAITTSSWRFGFQANVKRDQRQTIQIETGNPDWDAAFLLAQVNARTHFVRPAKDENEFGFIKTRLPDHTSFNQEDPYLSDSLTNLDLYHLSQVLMPASADMFAPLLEKHVIHQIERRKPNPEDKDFPSKKTKNGSPILATTVLAVYEITKNNDFLSTLYPFLTEFFRSWVSDHALGNEKEHLVWDTPAQLQIDTGLYTYDFWETYCKGLDITKAESPALYAMLYREAKALYKISKTMGERAQQRYFSRWQKELFKRLEDCWHEDDEAYGYQDIQSHLSPSQELHFTGRVKNDVEVKKTFIKPQRLQCHIIASDEHTRACTVKIKGLSTTGEKIEEVFKSQNILWVLGQAHLTTENLFGDLVSISFEGFTPDDQFILESADFTQQDITCLLPLWADAGSHAHRQSLASGWLDSHRKSFSYGIPETWLGKQALPEDLPIRVNVLWNTLIIDGIAQQGKNKTAASLYTNLMDAIIHGLKNYDGFYPLFDHKNGRPTGQYNALSGLIPIQLFLKIAGIKLFSPNKVAVWGRNPFPWSIEVHWRGLSLIKEQSYTSITFPNGAAAHHDSGKPVLISSETD